MCLDSSLEKQPERKRCSGAQEGAGWFSKEGRYRKVLSETGEWHTSMGRGQHLLQGVGAIEDSGWIQVRLRSPFWTSFSVMWPSPCLSFLDCLAHHSTFLSVPHASGALTWAAPPLAQCTSDCPLAWGSQLKCHLFRIHSWPLYLEQCAYAYLFHSTLPSSHLLRCHCLIGAYPDCPI